MSFRRSARLSALTEVVKAAADPVPPAVPPVKSRKRKVAPEDASPTEPSAAEPDHALPSTPQKRSARKAEPPPPATPTPSAIRLIAAPSGGAPATKRARPAAVTRLADPNATNATLLSPETSRIVASKPLADVSPSKKPTVRTTTATLLEDAYRHLIRVDERMRPLIEKHPCYDFSPEGLAEEIDPFESLVSGIISQQVSGAAATSIKARFVALFGAEAGADGAGSSTSSVTNSHKRFPHPSQVATMSIETLRTAGLSQRKAEYISGLAEKFVSGELSTQLLADAPYEEVLERLIAVRGLGRWSVEMFACFALKRMDVFSLGDLGVQRGMAAFVGRDVGKLKGKGGKWKYMTEKEMEEISDRFRPYRSLFMWYMWRVAETNISTLK